MGAKSLAMLERVRLAAMLLAGFALLAACGGVQVPAADLQSPHEVGVTRTAPNPVETAAFLRHLEGIRTDYSALQARYRALIRGISPEGPIFPEVSGKVILAALATRDGPSDQFIEVNRQAATAQEVFASFNPLFEEHSRLRVRATEMQFEDQRFKIISLAYSVALGLEQKALQLLVSSWIYGSQIDAAAFPLLAKASVLHAEVNRLLSEVLVPAGEVSQEASAKSWVIE